MIKYIPLLESTKNIRYDKSIGNIVVPPNTVIRLHNIGYGNTLKNNKKQNEINAKFNELVPIRKGAKFALHPDNWKQTFYSLTNKESKKIIFYKPGIIPITKKMLVADMLYVNMFFAGEEDAIEDYIKSIKPIEEADLSKYIIPEVIIPA